MARNFKSVQILDYLQRNGPMPLRELQRFAFRLNHPGEPFTREQRGYYCELLLGLKRGERHDMGDGTFFQRPAKLGLLSVFADKVDGLWVRNAYPHGGHPFRYLGIEQELEDQECGR